MAPKKPPGAKRGNSRKSSTSPPPPSTGNRPASHRTGPWGSQGHTDTLIVSTPPSPTAIANATASTTRTTPAPATASTTPRAATPTVTFDPDLYVINTPPASRSGSRHPSPFTRSPLLRGPGHLDEEGYDFHRIVKAKKTDAGVMTATADGSVAYIETDYEAAYGTPIVVGNLPDGITEEMLIEDARATTGIQVRAQEARPHAHLSASSTEGLTPAQLHAHSEAREAQLSSAQLRGRLSPTLTDEERLRARGATTGTTTPSVSSEFERRLEEDRVQAEEDRRLLQQLNSPTTTPP